jgi:hypothetical protein
MARGKEIATENLLQTYLASFEKLKNRLENVVSEMRADGLEEIPNFGAKTMEVSLANIQTGIANCESYLKAARDTPWIVAKRKAKPSPAATAGAIAAKKTPARTKGVTPPNTLSPEEKTD